MVPAAPRRRWRQPRTPAAAPPSRGRRSAASRRCTPPAGRGGAGPAPAAAPLAPHPEPAEATETRPRRAVLRRHAAAGARPETAKTLIVTHLECANTSRQRSWVPIMWPRGRALRSPEQPERVRVGCFKQCAWTCGGTKIVDTVELATSPTLNRGLNDTLERFASPETGPFAGPPGAPKRQSPTRTASVEFLFDDLEPVVLRVHDFDYLSRVATHVEALQRAEAGVSDEPKRTLLRCVSTTLTGDTFACARSLHAALCASYTVCKSIDTVVGESTATRSRRAAAGPPRRPERLDAQGPEGAR